MPVPEWASDKREGAAVRKRVASDEWSNRLCAALGQPLHEYGVKSISIDMPASGAVTVTIERHMREDELHWLVVEMKQFALTELRERHEQEQG